MRKTLFTLIIFLAVCCYSFSQNQADYNWVFGEKAGLNFSTDPPSDFHSEIFTDEAVASISNNTGELLFYTNGFYVWNRDNFIMPNGDSLHIAQYSYLGSSVTQGVIIVPIPSSENKYYVFTLAGPVNYGIQYSIVDMDMNASMGDVLEKNTAISHDSLEEKMQIVKHANGRDWWLIVRKWINTSTDVVFERFLITPDNIEGPWEQNYGPDFNYDEDNDVGWGQMIFSEQGDKLINTRGYHLDIYDFDRCTGEFSNHYAIKDIAHGGGYLYGCSFSPDGTKIYVSQSCGGTNDVYQYCLNCDILFDSTQATVYTGPGGSFCTSQHMLGPDDKIYITTIYGELPSDIFNVKNQNLCVVNNPNELYPDCNFEANTISLGTARSISGLPNMINYTLGALTGSGCDTITAINTVSPEKNNIEIYPNPANTFINVKSHLTNYQNTIASIYTIAGTKVKEIKLISSAQKIDIADLQQGLYTVVIRNDNNYLYSDKLVIIK